MSLDPALQAVRDDIPVAQRCVYLETAATGPITGTIQQAVVASMERRAWGGEGFFDDACRRADDVRGVIADHLGVDAAGIAFMKSTGEGINHVARTLDYPEGANVVISGVEFPSNVLPWKRLEREGTIELRIAAADDGGAGTTPEALAACVDEDTVLVSASWVAANTGYRHDVDAFGQIAHENEALLMVDGIQGLGAIGPPSMEHVDFWANGCHKWLMAPFGIGFLYVRPSLVADLEPDHVGWWSMVDPDDIANPEPRLAPDARRFEIGNLAFPNIEGYGAAFRSLPEERLRERQLERLTTRLMEGLGPLGGLGTPHDWARRAGIVRFETPNAATVHARLREDGVLASLRTGALRFAPHYWNTEDEVDRAVAAVRAAL